MEPSWNIGYSPEFPPIEAVFSKLKRVFNSQRLNNLVNKTGFNADKAIEAAFRTIKVDHCAACVRKSFFLLKRES
jgi:transposase